MNKSIKRLVSVLLAAAVLCALGVSALADVPNSDEYTVTLSAGNLGETVDGVYITGQTTWTVKAGDPVEFGTVVGLDDSPYYFKGFRPAGEDNNVVYANGINNVTEDTDYVAAYGLRGDLVAYTVTYTDAAGNELVRSEPHYGNVGDKIVVRARNFDRLQPQAYELGKTLVEDESENVFPFVYTEIVVPTPVPAQPAPTPYVYTEGAEGGAGAGGAAGGGAAAGGGLPAGGGAVELPGAGGEAAVEGEEVPEAGGPEEGGEPAAETEPTQAPEQAAAPTQGPETAQIDEEDTPQANAPAEYIDLDDTPTGEKPEIKEKPQTELQQERAQSERKFYIAAGLLGVSLIAIVALVVALVRRRKA